MKLEWRKGARSVKQLEDAHGVVQACPEPLDWTYMNRWAEWLNVLDDLDALCQTGSC